MTTELQKRQLSSVPVAFGKRGIEVGSMDELARFAVCVVESGMAPKGDSAQAVAVKVQMGLELGVTPMQAIQGIAVINGRPAVWGDLMLALCQASEWFDHAAFSEKLEGQSDTLSACVTVRRKPDGNLVMSRFSVANAKRAKLWGKAGPWTDYPERMLVMRARAFALRNTFSDVLKGLSSAEEVRDMPEERRPTESIFANVVAQPMVEIAAPEPPEPEQEAGAVEPEPTAEPDLITRYRDLIADCTERLKLVEYIGSADVDFAADPAGKETVLGLIKARDEEIKGPRGERSNKAK